jgi:hypothetical protein
VSNPDAFSHKVTARRRGLRATLEIRSGDYAGCHAAFEHACASPLYEVVQLRRADGTIVAAAAQRAGFLWVV